jgi:predicted phosphoribosyltransferase
VIKEMDMEYPRQKPVFANRFDAGRQLADKLLQYRGRPIVVLAIPNGGVPVALQVALALGADLDLVISRKLPLPLRPEGGFGAVADDGTVIYNQEMIKRAELTQQQIGYQVSKVRGDIQKRSLFYRGTRPLSTLSEKIAIIVDDGLASGYTMLAAVESIRRKHPTEIVVAVPAASAMAVKKVEKVADRVVTVVTDFSPRFYVSDHYSYWHVLSDEEGQKCLAEWRRRRYDTSIKPPPKSVDF